MDAYVDPRTLTPDERLELTIDYLPLTMRALNCLKNDRIETVGQILKIPDYELLRIPNLGAKTLSEIKAALEVVLGSDYTEHEFVRWCIRNRERIEPMRKWLA